MKRTFVASLSFEVQPGASSFQLLPSGDFRANDGRPVECAAWRVTPEGAQRLVAAMAARKTPMVLDYEHQSLTAATSGTPAPAAAWVKAVEWREGQGLYATDVEWTQRAAEFVQAREYRFISPVFAYDEDGNVLQLLNAALTNSPAIDGMDEVTIAAASRLISPEFIHSGSTDLANPLKEQSMKELLAALRQVLALPETATEADAIAKLNALSTTIGATAAASIDVTEVVKTQGAKIAALTTATPDPAKYVPIETMTALRNQVAELTNQAQQGSVDGLVTAALSDGRLLPAQEGWARDLGKSNVGALKQYLDTAKPIAALRSLQTDGRRPTEKDNQPGALVEGEVAVCRQLGLTPADYAKAKGAAQ
ncbi:phage protease [Burkholderia gladioli]|uniref:phage protease n=1 Tax=Burkholderia gladioli TaxID=28095 RepID=UPI00163E19AC|nr:phage protease [Burkholderia gladioli]